MDQNTALSMEAAEMEKMKRTVTAGSSILRDTRGAGTNQNEKDLISFFDTPAPVPYSSTDWSYFERGISAANSMERSKSAKDFSRRVSSNGRLFDSIMVQSPTTPSGMKRSGSANSFVRSPYAPSTHILDYVTPASQQQPLFNTGPVNPFEDNFVHTGIRNPAAFPTHNIIQRRSTPTLSSTPPGVSIPSIGKSSESFFNQPSLGTSWAASNSFFPPENQAKDSSEKEQSKADEINDVFQRWLDVSWSSTEKGIFDEKNSQLSPSSPTDNWREWDPLHVSPDAATSLSGIQVPIPESLKNDVNKETKQNLQQNQTMQEQPSETVASDGTSKEQFLNSMVQIRSTFPCHDPLSNPGYLISPMMPRWQCASNEDKDHTTVKISIRTDDSRDPVVFTCNINAAVELVVSQALCIVHEDISQITTSDYRFKIEGRQEFLLSGTTLNLYEFIQDCIKFDEDVHLQLVHRDEVDKSLIRTESDPYGDTLRNGLQKASRSSVLTWDNIQIVKDAYFSEIEKLQKHQTVVSQFTISQQCDRVHQAVKVVCQVLGTLKTIEVTYAMLKLKAVIEKCDLNTPVHQDIFNVDGSITGKPTSAILMASDNSMTRQDRIDQAVENLTSAVSSFINMYTKAMELDSSNKCQAPNTVSCNVHDLVTLNVVSIHRLPIRWPAMYEEYNVSCQLLYGNHELTPLVVTKKIKSNKSFDARITLNGWLTFPIKVSELPRETKLCLTLHGYPTGREPGKNEKIIAKEIAWVNIALFDHRSMLYQGSALYGMWSGSDVTPQLKASAMCSSNITKMDSVVVCIQLGSSEQKTIMFPPYSVRLQLPRTIPNGALLSTLDESTQQDLAQILNKNPMSKLSDHEQNLLWKHRHIKEYVRSRGSLARILRSVPSWTPKNLYYVYQLLEAWPSIEPIEAFELLSVSFPDKYVRKFAIRCIQQAEEDEIHDYLVQLTQALKYEMFSDSTLSRFLLRSALGSLRIAHKLYWLLSENMNADYVAERYLLMLNALEATSGVRMKKEFDKEIYIVKMVNRVAEAVKYAKDNVRVSILEAELGKVATRVKKHSFRLPTNPALVSNGIDVENSSYFTSNATPLRLAFNNAETNPKHFHLMFKVGDDLRQDVITMQLVRIMDKLWLAEGLDLKMVTFACLSTGKDRGFIELVSDSITLREIHSSYGLTGAFKDRPIAEWLQKHNPTAISYEKAEENFTLSCAGYCVATYVLGICDRHNDNIMLRQSGHLFHIDFARFLGHAQMFGNIKRDRAPFVLTSDMAYVINGGDRPSSRFHDFVDICCRAFNIIRENYHIFINLLSLMIHSGIPELKSISDLKYVYDALKPTASESEATAMFTRLIEASLSSSFTRINFFIHNLAQLRFHGNENDEKNSLSFTSKIHTADEDGVVVEAVVVGYQKQYNPEKYYVFCVRLKRELRSGESYIYRTFNEFAELHNKLTLNFTSWKPPSFPNKVIVGRSQIKQVAERRKTQLNIYLGSLLNDRLVVAKSNLIYTFFHPMLRDEQGYSKPRTTPRAAVGNNISGEIKLSVHHKNNALFIMIMHCRNLLSPDGNDPDPYVKTYLLPDVTRSTKRKTKVVRKTLHPTYNEMLIYDVDLSEVTKQQLYISVWNYEQLNENDFLGSVTLQLDKIDLGKENTAWYPLTSRVLSTR